MGDKLKQTISVVAEFVDGEAARAAKLNTLGAQLRNAADKLEDAVGDLYGDSYPYSSLTTSRLTVPPQKRTTATDVSGATDRYLDIANLARLVGPSSKLNPRMLERAQVQDVVPSGAHQFQLTFRPEGVTPADYTWSDTVVFNKMTGSAVAMDIAGDYFVDTDGNVHTYSVMAGGTVDYYTDPTTYAGGMNPQLAGFNTIPDIAQVVNGAGCVVTGPVAGVYTITLPTVTHQQSDYTGSTSTLAALDPNTGIQLDLPKIFTDNFLAGEILPTGTVYLKNWTGNTAYVDGVYKFNTATSVTVSGVDLDAGIAAGDAYYLVTVGSDITTALDDLRVKSYHSHDRSFGEPGVAASALAGIYSGAPASGPYAPSAISGNHFAQYMHRDGYTADPTLNDDNMMRGDLALGYAGQVAGSVSDAGGAETTTATHGVMFGNPSSGGFSKLYRTATGRLKVEKTGGSSVYGLWLSGPSVLLDGGSDLILQGVGSIIDVQGLAASIRNSGVSGIIETTADTSVIRTTGDTAHIRTTGPNSNIISEQGYGQFDAGIVPGDQASASSPLKAIYDETTSFTTTTSTVNQLTIAALSGKSVHSVDVVIQDSGGSQWWPIGGGRDDNMEFTCYWDEGNGWLHVEMDGSGWSAGATGVMRHIIWYTD